MNADLDSIFDPARVKRRVLLLDYDGTLVPFAPSPELAAPDAALLSILEALAARADTTVHVVSGRCRHTLEAWLGHLPIGLHAEHGYWTRDRARSSWTARFADEHGAWMARASEAVAAHVAATPGSFIERKSSGLAWHYRNSDPGRAAAARALIRAAFEPLSAEHGLDLLDGVCVLELRQGRANKGHVVRDVVATHEADAHFVAIGDDVTDEDMFAALPPGGFAIAAGARATSPRHRLDGPVRVRHFLQRLCESPPSTMRVRAAQHRPATKPDEGTPPCQT